ncbi:hypothetical protein MMC24_007763 [Lignoscripta atroalba]|nr:hypothetical protein [Lignoscripta atroalba]
MASPNPPQFPNHTHPRTWLLTSAASPLGIALARAVLAHGDSVVLGVGSSDVEKEHGKTRERAEDFGRFVREEIAAEGWRDRCRVDYEFRNMGPCQAAVAEAVAAFGKIDILICCTSEAVIGTVEELAASQRTLTLVRQQFETNFFGQVNIIKATLPAMREKRTGHIIVLTGITSHLGTPGLGIYCASGWALEGFCDSLAYEIAPFNIKMTILQPNLEINVLTNKITSAPLLPQYSPDSHPAPLSRTIIGGILDRLDGKGPDDRGMNGNYHHSNLSSDGIETLYPRLPPQMKSALIAETLHALTAIGGHENPPGRHIVGFEGVGSVKEKLKTVSEELEDFVEVSGAVDIEPEGDSPEGMVNGVP